MSSFIPVVLTLLLCMSVLAAAQDELCNCSPVQYTFQLKLKSVTCPANPNDLGPGVDAYTCDKSGGELPVKITAAQFTIQEPDGTPFAGKGFGGSEAWVDGDMLPIFTFPDPDPQLRLVGRIVLFLRGETADGSVVVNTWTIFLQMSAEYSPCKKGQS